MAKKSEYTTNTQIKSALRKLWLRSRERSSRLKKDGYTCQRCGGKQSKAKGREFKVEVHHKEGVENWQEIYKVIRKHLLTNASELETLCPECHKKEGKHER